MRAPVSPSIDDIYCNWSWCIFHDSIQAKSMTHETISIPKLKNIEEGLVSLHCFPFSKTSSSNNFSESNPKPPKSQLYKLDAENCAMKMFMSSFSSFTGLYFIQLKPTGLQFRHLNIKELIHQNWSWFNFHYHLQV